jgi:hypothetical protein
MTVKVGYSDRQVCMKASIRHMCLEKPVYIARGNGFARRDFENIVHFS